MCPEISGRSPSEIPGGNLIRQPDICTSKEALLISDGPEETSRHALHFRMGHSIPSLHKQSSFLSPSQHIICIFKSSWLSPNALRAYQKGIWRPWSIPIHGVVLFFNVLSCCAANKKFLR
ncbi:hypothetical protein TNIN_151031 [Trichonephila inaurata madagascariensis]|uniref:Uncharacterized protein n=1 Tax=Trichonephila inaurata madagascariensis TaxID=2747483 RepID=A0A8X6Y3L9_9ARAC|nr:hypothetical protein TNIN_151031 [Trichonephila inaurata madagascariensis]